MPTKVHLVKAMVFPVVMYGCESWAIKKAEHQRTDTFELWCWRRLLRVLWTSRRSHQSILKEINPEYSLEGLMLKLKLQYFWLPDDSPWTSQLYPTSWNLCCCCSVVQLCLTFCNSMDYSMPGLPVHHQLLKLAQALVH